MLFPSAAPAPIIDFSSSVKYLPPNKLVPQYQPFFPNIRYPIPNVKPNFDLGNGLFVNADLGIHGWQQEENMRFLGATAAGDNMVDDTGVDGFYGIGAGIKKGDFEFSVNYKDYDMYYDAEIIGASLKYNF